eukprot:809416-Amphidinium_carterae.1
MQTLGSAMTSFLKARVEGRPVGGCAVGASHSATISNTRRSANIQSLASFVSLAKHLLSIPWAPHSAVKNTPSFQDKESKSGNSLQCMGPNAHAHDTAMLQATLPMAAGVQPYKN